MDDNKRMLLAVVITMALLAVYQIFFLPVPPELQDSAAVATEETTSTEVTSSPAVADLPSVVPTASLPVMAEAAPQREIVVETPLYRLRLTTAGARLLSAELKNYRENPGDAGPMIDLFRGFSAGEGALGLVGSDGLSLAENQPYTVDLADNRMALSVGETARLVFTAQTAQGLQIARSFTFHADSYQIDTELQLQAPLPLNGRLGVVLSVPWDDATEVSSYSFTGPTVWTGEDRENVKIKNVTPEGKTFDTAEWTAFVTKYFMAALVINDAPGSVKIARQGHLIRQTLWLPLQQIGTEPQTLSLTGYIGPRQSDHLEQVGHNLQKSMEYGIFAPLAVPLLHVLKFFYAFIGNYGWAIILLTVLIKLLFWPLTHKSYKSMKGMQKLQPKMQQLREKYKSDKQRLNTEMMQLYREHRVNPMSGCLPMVIQIPVFFALYRVLLGSIELRHAPFALWLTDLSAKDPYYITPVIMGATMFLQQKLSPTTMDPAQAKIFMLMPLVFTFMFLNFPSGLVIYWLVNNVLSIVQQLVINRQAQA